MDWAEQLRRDVAAFNEHVAALPKNTFPVLSGADLSGLDLRGARITGADLSGADLRGAKVDAAALVRCRIEGTNLDGTAIEGPDANAVPWLQALWQGAAAWNAMRKNGRPPLLIAADLRGARLRGADLSGVSLTSARLRGPVSIVSPVQMSSCEPAATLMTIAPGTVTKPTASTTRATGD